MTNTHAQIAATLHDAATDMLNGNSFKRAALLEQGSASISSLAAQLAEARELLRPMINGTEWITPEQIEAARAFLAKP